MNALEVLEKNIAGLVELVKKYKENNTKLAEEKAELVAKIKSIESSLLDDSQQVQKLSAEREETKSAVDDLISVIDSLVETENRQK